MSPLTLFYEIMALGGKAAAVSYRDNAGFAVLLRYGFLREAGLLSSVVCDDCENPHAAPVVFEGGRYGHHGPDLGFVALDRMDVQAVMPDPRYLIERLAELTGCKRRKQTPVLDQTWRIGALETDAGEIMLYFHPKLQNEEDARDLEHALGREVRARWRLIVTAVGTLPVAGARTVQLDDLATLDAETGALRILIPLADLVGVPRKNKGGRPSEHSAALAEIISDRKKSGAELAGLNAEAKAIRSDFETLHPGLFAPSEATVKRHLAKARGGS